MNKVLMPLLLCSSVFYLGCSQEPRERSVREFLDNPQFLEAAVVRCSQNRAESRYDAECINARQAVSVVEAREERAQRDKLEAESESKRDALRRRQRTAEAARRLAAEREQLRKEAEYLAQFGESLPDSDSSNRIDLEANVPGAVIPKNTQAPQSGPQSGDDGTAPVIFDEPIRENSASIPASDGGNAPGIDNEAEPDLGAVRDELRRRQDEGSD